MTNHTKRIGEDGALLADGGDAEPVAIATGTIDANVLEILAKERPDECFLRGTGILKLTGAIRTIERENRELKAKLASAQPIKQDDEIDLTIVYLDGYHKGKKDGIASAQPTNSDVWDAERYRWLRNESWAGYNNSKRKPQVFETVTMILGGARNFETILAEEALDEAIDAAIAADTSKPNATDDGKEK